jgi:hypothetical protein
MAIKLWHWFTSPIIFNTPAPVIPPDPLAELNAYYWNGTIWKEVYIYHYNGSAWIEQEGLVRAWNGTSWSIGTT